MQYRVGSAGVKILNYINVLIVALCWSTPVNALSMAAVINTLSLTKLIAALIYAIAILGLVYYLWLELQRKNN